MKKLIFIVIAIMIWSIQSWAQCSNPNAGIDTEICGFTVNLSVTNATTGSWAAYSDGVPVVVSFLPDNTATDVEATVEEFEDPLLQLDFVWTDLSGPCTDTVMVSFYRKPQPFAGLDDAVCGNIYELEGLFDITESAVYTPSGVWSLYNAPVGEAANISPVTNDTAHAIVSQVGIWHFVIRENNSYMTSCNSTDTVQIEFLEIPVIYAGDDVDVCGACTQLNGISGGFDGYWLPALGASCMDYSQENTDVCVASYGTYTFIWYETNQAVTTSFECYSMDSVDITFWNVPSAEILSPATDTTFVCGFTFNNLVAENPGTGIVGYWYCTNPAVDFGNEFSTSTWATVPHSGFYDLYWIEETGPVLMPGFCTDTAGPVTIAFALPDANIISDISDTIISCGLMYNDLVAANPGIANGYWVSESSFTPIGGTDLNSPEIDIMVDMPTVAEFYWILQHGPAELNCADTAGPAIIRFLSEPTAEIITDMSDTIFNCGDTYYNLLAESPGSQFDGYWDTPSISSIMFGDWNNEETSVTTCAYGLRSFYWIVQHSDYPSCKDTAGPVNIYFLSEMSSFAGDDNSIFGSDYILTGEISEFYNPEIPRTILWENPNAVFSNPQNDTTLVTVLEYDEYEFVLSAYYTDHPECGDADTVSVSFQNPFYPYVDNVVANIDFSWAIYHPDNNDVTVYLYQQISEKSSNPVYELKAQKHLESNGQVVFESIDPGIYYLSSSIANTEDYPQLLENIYSGNSLIIDDAEAIVKTAGASEFISLDHAIAPDFYGTNIGYGKVGYVDGEAITGVADQVVVLYNSDSDEVLDVSITNMQGYYYFSMIPDNTNIEIFVSSFEHPQHTSFTTLTTNSVQYYVPFALENQLAYPFEENSIEPELTNKVQIFPNPAKDCIFIDSKTKIDKIVFTDLNGRQVLQIESSFSEIDISALEQGVYFIKISTAEGAWTTKIVKQ